MKQAEEISKKLGWKILERGWNKLIVHPHEDCEDITLHWHKTKVVKNREGWDLEKEKLKGTEGQIDDNDWFCGGFTKTHYAGVKVHIQVAEFLRFIAGRCQFAEVYDEADYYEEGYSEKKVKQLKEYWGEYDKMLGNLANNLKKVFGPGNVISGGDLK